MIRYQTEVVNKARALREQKLSFYAISKLLNIPRNTIRSWCHDLVIDRHESLKINNEYRRKSLKSLDINLIPSLSNIEPEQARFLAALLYGCEGSKYPASNIVAFVNSDQNLIKTFIFLLRKGFELDESKFRIHLQLHDTHNIVEITQYWSSILNIPTTQFIKPTITTARGKMRRQNYLGTCSVRYSSNKIQLRLLGIYEMFCNIGEVA